MDLVYPNQASAKYYIKRSVSTWEYAVHIGMQVAGPPCRMNRWGGHRVHAFAEPWDSHRPTTEVRLISWVTFKPASSADLCEHVHTHTHTHTHTLHNNAVLQIWWGASLWTFTVMCINSLIAGYQTCDSGQACVCMCSVVMGMFLHASAQTTQVQPAVMPSVPVMSIDDQAGGIGSWLILGGHTSGHTHPREVVPVIHHLSSSPHPHPHPFLWLACGKPSHHKYSCE